MKRIFDFVSEHWPVMTKSNPGGDGGDGLQVQQQEPDPSQLNDAELALALGVEVAAKPVEALSESQVPPDSMIGTFPQDPFSEVETLPYPLPEAMPEEPPLAPTELDPESLQETLQESFQEMLPETQLEESPPKCPVEVFTIPETQVEAIPEEVEGQKQGEHTPEEGRDTPKEVEGIAGMSGEEVEKDLETRPLSPSKMDLGSIQERIQLLKYLGFTWFYVRCYLWFLFLSWFEKKATNLGVCQLLQLLQLLHFICSVFFLLQAEAPSICPPFARVSATCWSM